MPPEPDRIDAAIMLAALTGYLAVRGKPAHSVAVTAAGLALLKERDMA